ncbi:MAG: glycosyltransferase family 1 protein [Acidobacteriota bacterium]
MQIAIDAHSVGTQLAGNVTYITSLIEALAEIDQNNQYTLYVTKPEAVEKYAGRWSNFSVRRTLPHTPLIRIPITLAIELRRRPVDILFVQYTAPLFVPCKVVTTIHDISYEHLPETYKRRSRFQMKLTIRHTARSADHVIASSEYSRQDLIDTYHLPTEKVTAIPLAAPNFYAPVTDTDELDRIRKKYDLAEDFILGVGSIQPRKNLGRLIEAYAMLAKKRNMPPLVLVGRKAWLSGETLGTKELAELGDKVRFTGFVPDEDLPPLYSAAKIFVYPSFFEGFGLPPLEAMQCGTPVITGDRTSLPEVVGDAGILVDPFDVQAIADNIEKLLLDDELCADLSRRGLERAKQFSWNSTARQTLDVFERIVA